MDLYNAIVKEFEKDYEKCFKDEIPNSLESIVQSEINGFLFEISMNIEDLFAYKDSESLLSKLKNDNYNSRLARKNRLLKEIESSTMSLSEKYNKTPESINKDVDDWNVSPNEIYLIRIPYCMDVCTKRILYNNFLSDMKIGIYNIILKSIQSRVSNTYTFPENVHGVVSISSKTAIQANDHQPVLISTSTSTFQYPSKVNFYNAINEALLDDYKKDAIMEHSYKQFSNLDLKVFGFICHKLKIEIFNNETMVTFNVRELIEFVYSEYRSVHIEKVLSSIVKMALLKISKDGLIMGFLSNFSLSKNKEDDILVTTTLDSFIAQQIKNNQVVKLDKKLYDIVENDLAQSMILPLQTLRFREYLTKKNEHLSKDVLKIDWIWLSKHLGVSPNIKPSIIMNRIESALKEYEKKNVLIDRFTREKNTFMVYLKDISSSEKKFIKDNYEKNQMALVESLKILT